MTQRVTKTTAFLICTTVFSLLAICPMSFAKGKHAPKPKKEPTPLPWSYAGWVSEINTETRQITVRKEKELVSRKTRKTTRKKKTKSEEATMSVTLSNDVVFVFGHSTVPMSEIKVNDPVKLKGARFKGQAPVITMVVKLTEEAEKEKEPDAGKKKTAASRKTKSAPAN